MKKICLLFCALTATVLSASAQAVPGGDMEAWRNNTSGAIPVTAVPVHAPVDWYGIDSLIIYDGQVLGPLVLSPGPHSFYAQVFQETTVAHVHGGASSAKLMTLKQDTLGFFPGILSNAQISINVASIISGGVDPLSAISYSGGTAVTQRITTVSAYVQYLPGFDSGTHVTGVDTAVFSVEAHATVSGADSIVGFGVVLIPPTASFTQVTANVLYTDTINKVNNLRILFLSSGGATNNLDSSVLYVDDVTMTGVPQTSHVGVQNVATNNSIKVYPNPATNTVFLTGAQNAGLTCTLLSVNGQVVATKTLTGNDALDVSGLAGGMYIYTITNNAGKAIQKGNITLNR